MKLWDKGYATDKKIDLFTVGNDRELDLQLAKYDCLGNLAQSRMLNSIGTITDEELKGLEVELNNILKTVEDGTFTIEDSFEDVHSKVEWLLTEKLGDAGKKIHTARSRNDQVLLDVHLYSKDAILELKDWTKKLFDLLIELAENIKITYYQGIRICK